ncbi:MAG TPA: anaerobic ribonucleoside-triphosphate reductase activating protein [Phycisphaerae bacterium]|nr:anaerobic ribonucleoside-triphosphate reductase activating protein [Phycisphaerae bacterium]
MTADAATSVPPIVGYHPTTLIDWPGRLATIVFLPRCNLRCPFCHSGFLLGDPPETIPLEAILEHIESRGDWIDGVVICGGEPTLWPGLAMLCAEFRRAGLEVKLDTNGTRPDRLAQLLEANLVDAVAMDLKAPLDERYYAACGRPVDLDALDCSIRLLMASKIEHEFRTTACPTFIGEQEIHDIGARIAGASRWVLQRFEPANALDPSLREVPPHDWPTMGALAEIGRAYVGRCLIRGQPEPEAAHIGA